MNDSQSIDSLDNTHEPDQRSVELRGNLTAVQKRISAAAAAAGREDGACELVVVTKFHTTQDIRRLAAMGVQDVGESRDQEAAPKSQELGELALKWHFVGQIQTNKAKSVARYAHAVHSVDRLSLVTALSKGVVAEQEQNNRPDLQCFIQLNLDPSAEAGRGGASPEQLLELGAAVDAAVGLELYGVMAVAPLGSDPDAAFAQLAEHSRELRQQFPHARYISAGMSGDLEHAIRYGATHLRIGSDVLGPRPPIR
ncbi:YggS family pyridoxal phosphate-dependent enzyme [Pseudarthrobacter sp. J1738]|uniref:YggS family pyridoxal phosphate-dependent enzyme n=1 Tax=unclassified Pseudarthrobacter TaxID=2647000 RepID=UPI003D2AC96E